MFPNELKKKGTAREKKDVKQLMEAIIFPFYQFSSRKSFICLNLSLCNFMELDASKLMSSQVNNSVHRQRQRVMCFCTKSFSDEVKR